MKNYKIINIALFFLITYFLAPYSNASDENDVVTIRLGAFHANPFGMKDSEGRTRVNTFQVIEAGFKELGIEVNFEYVIAPHYRLERLLFDGKIDIAPMAPTEEIIANTIRVSDPLNYAVLLVSKKTEPVNSVESADDSSIFATSYYEYLNPGNKMVRQDSVHHYFQMLDSNRAKAVIASELTFRYLAKKLDVDLNKYQIIKIDQAPVSYFCSKQSPHIQLCKEWSDTLKGVLTWKKTEEIFKEVIVDIEPYMTDVN